MFGDEAKIVATVPGRELIGLRYAEPFPNVDDDSVHWVVAGPHVDVEEGTGINGFGAFMSAVIERHEPQVRVHTLGVPDRIIYAANTGECFNVPECADKKCCFRFSKVI